MQLTAEQRDAMNKDDDLLFRRCWLLLMFVMGVLCRCWYEVLK